MENIKWLTSLLYNPLTIAFAVGLGVGLLVACLVWVRGCMKLRTANKAQRKLREHLQTKLELDAMETERRKQECQALRQERDNLRNLVQVINQKPGRQEMRQLQVYQRAVEAMFAKSPGFAPVWQMTLQEAEEEVAKAENGLVPFIRRLAGMITGDRSKRPLELEQNINREA